MLVGGKRQELDELVAEGNLFEEAARFVGAAGISLRLFDLAAGLRGKEHAELVEALATRDARRAAETMRKHALWVFQRWTPAWVRAKHST